MACRDSAGKPVPGLILPPGAGTKTSAELQLTADRSAESTQSTDLDEFVNCANLVCSHVTTVFLLTRNMDFVRKKKVPL